MCFRRAGWTSGEWKLGMTCSRLGRAIHVMAISAAVAAIEEELNALWAESLWGAELVCVYACGSIDDNASDNKRTDVSTRGLLCFPPPLVFSQSLSVVFGPFFYFRPFARVLFFFAGQT